MTSAFTLYHTYHVSRERERERQRKPVFRHAVHVYSCRFVGVSLEGFTWSYPHSSSACGCAKGCNSAVAHNAGTPACCKILSCQDLAVRKYFAGHTSPEHQVLPMTEELGHNSILIV